MSVKSTFFCIQSHTHRLLDLSVGCGYGSAALRERLNCDVRGFRFSNAGRLLVCTRRQATLRDSLNRPRSTGGVPTD